MSWGNVSTKNKLNKFVDDTAFLNIKDLKCLGLTSIKVILVRFNKYSENKKMGLHADHIHSMFDGERKAYQY